VKTGEGGKMFGAVTANDIHEKLAQAGLEIDRRKIQLHTPVKTLGQHTVKIRLHAEVTVELSFDIVSENPIVPAEGETKGRP
jgi:large subunit ribosomal protein L9